MTNNWDLYWQEESNSDFWLKPDKAIVELIQTIERYDITNILDIGCGIGRHTLFLAEHGFNVTALDSSLEALTILKQRSAEKKVQVNILQGDYSHDILPEEQFDFVLAYNVIYHGDRARFRDSIQLIHKWLKPGGLLFFTCPTRRDDKYGSGEQLAPNTYQPLNSIHPGDIHYFADENDIQDFLHHYCEISKTIFEHYWDNRGNRQFSSYWRILASK